MDWQDVRMFVVLARQGSLSAAARMLGVNHATIARRLHSLEASLGEKLVERRPEGYVLTPAGTHALEAASEMEQAAQSLARGLADGAPGGLVRINASPGLASGFLVSRLPTLAARYPRLDIDLAPALRAISLERHEADIAIRFDKPKDGDVIARPLTTVGYGFYGTEAACRAVEAGGEPVFIGFNEADAYLSAATWMTRHFPRARVAFRAKDQFLQAIAARSGAGLALIPHYIGRADPLLRRCDLGGVPASKDVFLLTRTRDRKNASIRVVADEVMAMFEQDRALFE
ncbi:LysR family transcriptional regulator [Sphingomonas morindae]|uniref:LysR family transcriptional regulator n=1 Tax=Sphingomonas morindae TaxID=1541170 RepID=A0ABY4X965_9SPHN|nr:LysR family transcriptional regulator [Sphingomonas morindae]USI73457.1 LysR family transcriptional regulator [Sphingomonas morindae]